MDYENRLRLVGNCFRGLPILGVSAMALAVAYATPAYAQRAGDASAADSHRGLEEIVVTAQFRQQNLQDTPLAITAVSAEMMEARSYTNITDVSASAPNVTLRQASSGYGKSAQAYIRGIGQTDFNFARDAAVGFYVDDVYHATLFGSVFDLLDLERVEVLRGPQGTLFGKNSIGGAVRLITRKPQPNLSAQVEGTFGSYDRVDVRGMINIPLTETLFMRLSAGSKSREGYVKRIDFVCANPTLSGNLPRVSYEPDCQVGTLGNEEVRTARAALRWLPAPGFEINLTGEYLRETSEGAADVLIGITSNATVTRFNANILIPNFGIPFDERFITPDGFTSFATFDNSLIGRRWPSTNSVESKLFSGTVDVDLTDNIQVKTITAYKRYSGDFFQEADNSPLPFHNVYTIIRNVEQLSQEIRLLGSLFNNGIEWTAGGFYFKMKTATGGENNVAVSNLWSTQAHRANVENKSLYVHAIGHISDRLNLTAGIRYTDENKTYRYVSRTLPNLGTNFPDGDPVGTSIYDRLDYKLALDYEWTKGLMTYVQFSTGYRGGGVNPRPLQPDQVIPFFPENLEAYEVGLKSELFDRRVRLNIAGFFSNYTDMQLTASGLFNGAPLVIPRNVGKAHIKGIEVEFEAQPVPELLLNASIGYIDFKIKDLGAAAGVTGGPSLDSKAPGTPDWKLNVGVQYEFLLDGRGKLTPRFDILYQTKVYNEATSDERAAQPAYAIANGRLTWQSEDDDWLVALSVTNLTNKFYFVNKFIQSAGAVTGQPGRPREWGVSVRRRF